MNTSTYITQTIDGDGQLIGDRTRYPDVNVFYREFFGVEALPGENLADILAQQTGTSGETAAPSAEAIILIINSTYVTQGNSVLPTPPIAPQLIGGRTMLPFRYLVQDILGGEVDYDAETRRITATVNGTSIIMVVDQLDIYVDGVAYEYGQAPIVIGGSTLVPLRAFQHVLSSLDWDDFTQTVTIVP